MGEFLSTPIKDHVSEDGENAIVRNKFKLLVTLRSLRYARMEEKNGRFAHKRFG